MNVALDCRSVFEGCGGIGRYSQNLARSLAALGPGHTYTWILTQRPGAAIDVPAGRARSVNLPCAMIDDVFDQARLPPELARSGADLYHGTCFSIPVPECTRWRVSTIHDVVFRRHPEFVEPPLAAFLDKATEFAVLAADAIVAVSAHGKRELVELYCADADKVAVIPNGVEERFFRDVPVEAALEARRSLGVPERYVLYLGALEEKKNIPRLLAAWKLVCGLRLDPLRTLVLAGGAGGKPFDVAAEIDRQEAEHVIHAGWAPDELLPGLYAGADAFIYPSLYEGFGLPPLEAMAVGTPTIVSDASSLPETVGEGAMLVDPTSAEAMADSLVRVLTDAEHARRLAAAGRERARAFTWRRSAEMTLELYDSLGTGS